MEKKRILLLLGHPNNDSLCAALLQEYALGAKASGAELRVHRLADMQFDAALRLGFKGEQVLEPDLKRFQDDLVWCQHFVMAFPLWWGGMPGPLKGLIDRTFLPGVTFKYKENSPFQDKLLAGRSARVVMTMDSPRFWYQWVLGRPLTKALQRQILGFCGMKMKIKVLGNVRASSPKTRAKWLQALRQLGSLQG